MRPSFDSQRPVGGHSRFGLVLVLTAMFCFSLGAAATQRLSSFTDSVFAGSARPSELALVDEPEPEPTATPEPTMAPALATPALAAPTPTLPPTPTVRPTATPVDAASLVGKLRAGAAVSILLVGYGGVGHDGPYLTDALVVVHVDPRTNQLTLFNLPRDLMVQPIGPNGRPSGSFRRINEIYSAGLGAAAADGRSATPQEHDRAAWLTAAVAQSVLGLPIDAWVSADFDAVRKVVDGLGGVTVTVETAFDDYTYPRHDNPSIDGGTMHIHFDAGPQRLTGEQALQYARSRHAMQDGSDFGRSRRQQRLLLALKDEAIRPETLPKIFYLMNAVQGHLRTSLSLESARDIVVFGREREDRIRAASAIIDGQSLLIGTITSGGASVLMPRAGYGNYAAIHQFVRTSLRATPETGPNVPR